MYDPNFQQKGQEQGVVSQEGKLNMIRVKRLKFTLKGSNYEDAQTTALGGEERCRANFSAVRAACTQCGRPSWGGVYEGTSACKQYLAFFMGMTNRRVPSRRGVVPFTLRGTMMTAESHAGEEDH